MESNDASTDVSNPESYAFAATRRDAQAPPLPRLLARPARTWVPRPSPLWPRSAQAPPPPLGLRVRACAAGDGPGSEDRGGKVILRRVVSRFPCKCALHSRAPTLPPGVGVTRDLKITAPTPPCPVSPDVAVTGGVSLCVSNRSEASSVPVLFFFFFPPLVFYFAVCSCLKPFTDRGPPLTRVKPSSPTWIRSPLLLPFLVPRNLALEAAPAPAPGEAARVLSPVLGLWGALPTPETPCLPAPLSSRLASPSAAQAGLHNDVSLSACRGR